MDPEKREDQKVVRCMQLSNPRRNPLRIWQLFGLFVYNQFFIIGSQLWPFLSVEGLENIHQSKENWMNF